MLDVSLMFARQALRLLKDGKGVTALEYGLVAAGIAVGITVSTTNVGVVLGRQFRNIARSVAT